MANALERYFDEASRRIPANRFNTEDQKGRDELSGDHLEGDEVQASDDDVLIPAGERGALYRVNERLDPDSRLPGETRRVLDGGLREQGFDVLAFYKSRRNIARDPYPGKWGVFYLDDGVMHVAELISETYPGYGQPFQLAHDFLREHERFHLKFDLYALAVEATLGRSLYLPLKRAFPGRRTEQVEEALANRDAWKWATRGAIGLADFAFDFMKLQPGGYARFDEPKEVLGRELAANLIDLDTSYSARRDDQALWVGVVPAELLRPSLCPEYFVRPASLSNWINPAWKLPDVRAVIESSDVARLLSSKFISLNDRWEETKKKLIANPGLPGLDFKRWDRETGQWSVRVTDNFRAHLKPLGDVIGTWEADEFGPHTALRHG